MGSKKAILWPVIISIFIHTTLLAVTGMLDLRENIKPVEIFSVSIKEPEEDMTPEPEKVEKAKKVEAKSARVPQEKGIDVDDWREETVDLGSPDSKYVNYLATVKNKILPLWKYPAKSYANNEEGNVVVKISIDDNGRLAGAIIISSSGHIELDNGALSVVQTAAPFAPLPEAYNLSRLNVIASFRYKIRD